MTVNEAHALSVHDLHTLLGVTRSLAQPLALDALLGTVTAAATSVLRAERASVWLLDEALGRLVVQVSSDLDRVSVPLGTGFVGLCAQQRAPINVPDCAADPRFNPEFDRRTGFRTRNLLTLPLIDHHGGLVGVLQILNRRDGPFDAGDEALGLALAAQCAVAIDRVRTTRALVAAEGVRRELVLAAELQRSTLPAAMPRLPGYDMHGHFQPAAETGGDTYDLARVDAGLLVVLADATGHGFAPALSVTQMHAMLRMALRLGASLETAFRQVNDQLADTLPDGRFVTACIGLLDPGTHRLRLLSGGQGPILHRVAAEGRCAVHRATSFPMGAMPMGTMKPAIELTLAPGDWLVLASDGIYEYENAQGEPFGRARVEAILDDGHHAGAADLASRLLDAVRAFADGAPQEDDITLLLLKREPAAAAHPHP